MDTAEKKDYGGHIHKSVNLILVCILRTVYLTYGHSIFKQSENLQLTVYINAYIYILKFFLTYELSQNKIIPEGYSFF
jgi:hypothetical protein